MSRKDRGAALAIVLWALVVIGAVVAAGFARGLLTATTGREAGEEALGRALAQAGVSRFIRLFLADEDKVDSAGEPWLLNGKVPAPLAGGIVEVRAMDRGSCVNLNLAGSVELAALFPEDRGPVDAVLDWLDEDDETRPAGAERDYYAGLDPPILPANGFFRCPEDVLLVKGLAEQADSLAAETTVFGPANPNFFAPQTFRSLLREVGMTEWEAEMLAEKFSARRDAAGAGGRVPFTRVEDLLFIQGMTGSTLELLQPCLLLAGNVNPNLAGAAGLRSALARLYMNRADAIQKILDKRSVSPFKDLEEVFNMLRSFSPQLKKDWVAQVFTCQTRIAGVEAVGRTKAGSTYRISAVIERYRPDGESGRWRARILYCGRDSPKTDSPSRYAFGSP